MRVSTAILTLTTMAALCAPAFAQATTVPAYTVVPVSLQSGLNTGVNACGDTFYAVCNCENCEGFATGTRFLGVVTGAVPMSTRQTGMMTVEFSQAVLPDGTVVALQGKPVSLSPNDAVRDPCTGRLMATQWARDHDMTFVGWGDKQGVILGVVDAGSVYGGLVYPCSGWVSGVSICGMRSARQVDLPPGSAFGVMIVQDVQVPAMQEPTAAAAAPPSPAPSPAAPPAAAAAPPPGAPPVAAMPDISPAPSTPATMAAGPETAVVRVTYTQIRPYVGSAGVLMVPFRPTMDQLGYAFRLQRRTITADVGGRRIQHVTKSSVIFVDGEAQPMAARSVIVSGRLYVPQRAIEIIASKKASWDAASQALTLQ